MLVLTYVELSQYICFLPMALAEISTGFYLMIFSINTNVPGGPPVDRE